ncbi:hypothetical protein R3P38DRAFT_2776843 [Favolaschia claudopus]|uniref:Uncharacterized protein n=1 Tax=Favolaschia claudopus TaxID=2862362 RepID=A0AAW0BMP7_9AGAR
MGSKVSSGEEQTKDQPTDLQIGERDQRVSLNLQTAIENRDLLRSKSLIDWSLIETYDYACPWTICESCGKPIRRSADALRAVQMSGLKVDGGDLDGDEIPELLSPEE